MKRLAAESVIIVTGILLALAVDERMRHPWWTTRT